MKKAVSILVIILTLSLTSCMMMMPHHMSDSMSEGHNHDASDMKIDPVCGKQVGEENSYTYMYMEKTYHFDSEQCVSVFKSNPEHFVHKHDRDTNKKTWNKVGWIGGAVVMTTMMVFMLSRIL